MFIQSSGLRIMQGSPFGLVYLAVDETEGDPHSGEEKLNSPKTYLHISPYPEQHVRSYADKRSRCASRSRQYLSVAYTEHLDAAGIKPSTAAVGSSHDNALAESIIGLYKTELIKPRRPWKGIEDLEIATAEWVDWFNHRRPFEYCDDLTPVEAEAAHYVHHQAPATAGVSS